MALEQALLDKLEQLKQHHEYAHSVRACCTAIAIASTVIVAITYKYVVDVGTLLLTDSRLPYRKLINNVNAILAESMRREKKACCVSDGGKHPRQRNLWTVPMTESQNLDNVRADEQKEMLESKLRMFASKAKITLDNQKIFTTIDRYIRAIEDIEQSFHTESKYVMSVYLAMALEIRRGKTVSVPLIELFSNDERVRTSFDIDAAPKDYIEYQANTSREPLQVGWNTSGSELTKWITIYTVWSWNSVFMSLLMVVSSLSYNGAYLSHLHNDAVPRIVLTCSIAILQTLHTVSSIYCYNVFLRRVTEGSAWSLLQRSGFMVVRSDKIDYDKNSLISIHKASQSFESRNYGREPGHDKDSDDITKRHEQSIKEIKDSSDKFRKVATDEAKSAAEKSVSIALIYLTVTVTYGFTVWTSSPSNTLTTQIGSWGLLVSTLALASLMMASIISITTSNASYEHIISQKEIIISQNHRSWYEKRSNDYYPFGFIEGTVNRDHVSRFKGPRWYKSKSELTIKLRGWIRDTFPRRSIYFTLMFLIKKAFIGPAIQMVPDSSRETNKHALNFCGLNIVVTNKGYDIDDATLSAINRIFHNN